MGYLLGHGQEAKCQVDFQKIRVSENPDKTIQKAGDQTVPLCCILTNAISNSNTGGWIFIVRLDIVQRPWVNDEKVKPLFGLRCQTMGADGTAPVERS